MSVPTLSQYQMPLDCLLRGRDAVLSEPEVFEKPSGVEPRLDESRVLHCPISEGLHCKISYLFRLAKLMLQNVDQFWAEVACVFVNWRDTLRFILKNKTRNVTKILQYLRHHDDVILKIFGLISS